MPPNQPATPNHTVRSPSWIWGPAKAKAADNGLTMTDVVNKLLEEWARDYRERGIGLD